MKMSGERDSSTAATSKDVEGMKSSSANGAEALPPLTRKTDTKFIARVKFKNSLPDVPFDPKLIQYQFEEGRFVEYQTTSLEKKQTFDVFCEPLTAVPIELVDPDVYAVGANMDEVELHPDDEELLRDEQAAGVDQKRSRTHAKALNWLRRTEYISSEYGVYRPSDQNKEKPRHRPSEAASFIVDTKEQIDIINRTFEAAKKPITKHPVKKNLKAVEVLPLLPDTKLWGTTYCEIIFDGNPLGQHQKKGGSGKHKEVFTKEEEEILRQGVLRTLGTDKESYIFYFLPTRDTVERRKTSHSSGMADPENMSYKVMREYEFDIKQHSREGPLKHLFFVKRPGEGVFYNSLGARVTLQRPKPASRKKKDDVVRPNRGMLNFRPYTDDEMEMREQKLQQLYEGEEDDLDAAVAESSNNTGGRKRAADDEWETGSPRGNKSPGYSSSDDSVFG